MSERSDSPEPSETHPRHQTNVKTTNEAGTAGVKNALDRQKVCPMYVRLFCRLHGHHQPSEFSRHSIPTEDELSIYTWRDATLSELADLVKEVNLECRRRDARFDFQLVWVDLRGRYCFKPLGQVANARKGRDDGRSLEELRFVQGDFIDVAIYFANSPTLHNAHALPSASTSAAAAASASTMPRRYSRDQGRDALSARENNLPYNRSFPRGDGINRRPYNR